MKRAVALGVAMFAGAIVGAAAIQSLYAQAKPSAYVIYERGDATNDAYTKEFVPTLQKSVRDSGGKFLRAAGAPEAAAARRILSIAGEPPKNIILIQFESLEKAQAWADSSVWKDAVPIGQKSTSYFRVFAVEGLPQ